MSTSPDRSIVRVRGRDVGYWRNAAPAGVPKILLIHGLGASAHIWESLGEALGSKVELWALDLPGCGASAPGNAEGPLELATSTLAFMDAVGLEKVAVAAGHSLGGAVVMELALQAPQRLGGIMVVNAAPTLPALARLSLRAPGVSALLGLPDRASNLPHRFLTELYLARIFGEAAKVTPQIIEGYARLADAPDFYRNMSATLQGFARHRRPLADLHRIDLPVSLVWGERDPLFPLSLAQKLVRAMPRAALHRLPRCGHCPPQEDPATVAELVCDLVARVGREPFHRRTGNA